MWPSRWFPPTSGFRCTYASDFATAQPTRSEPTSPGPWVAAMPSRSGSRTEASRSACWTTGTMTSRCRREASSGTTPPYGAWIASWEATTLHTTHHPLPDKQRGRCGRDRRPAIAPGVRRRLLRPDLSLLSACRALLLEDAHRLDHVDRPLDLDVLPQLLQRIEHGLALTRSPVFFLRQLDHDVGRDALAVDGAPLRRVVLRGRQPESRPVGERDDRLHRALAEGLRADDDRAPPVLERPRHDLRRGGATP